MIEENKPCVGVIMAAIRWNVPEDKRQGSQITKTEFDILFDKGDFKETPEVDTFGDGYGEPYNPNRQAWGLLKDGRLVWAWVSGQYVKKEKEKEKEKEKPK